MKHIIALMALALISFGAQARIDENSSWKEIRRSSGLHVDTPKITFKGGSVFVPVFGICHYDANGVSMLSAGTFKECVKWAQRGDDQVCVKERTIALEKARTNEVTSCTRWTQRGDDQVCTQYRTYTKTVALDYDIDVYQSRRGGEHDTYPAFTKEFSIPSCK